LKTEEDIEKLKDQYLIL